MSVLFRASLITFSSIALAMPASGQCPPSGKGGGNSAPSNPGVPSGPSTPAPSGPSTPAPSGPTTPTGPTPSGPTTPRAAGPVTPRGPAGGPRTPRGRGGFAITFTRGSTSKERLDLDWDFPVLGQFGDDQGSGTTYARRAKVALPAVDAYAKIAGKDSRPLLVLRECGLCKGSDAALLRRSMGDEKTKLLAHWFHCVKLPPDVMNKNHPFRNLFPEAKPPHLFFAKPDGSERVTLTGNMKQADLHKAMMKTLEANYKKSPKPALKVMMRLLSEFDNYDIMLNTQKRQLRTALYKNKPTSSKVKKLKAKIAATEKKKAKAMRSAKAVCDLKLITKK